MFAEFHNLAHKDLLPGSNVLFFAAVDPASTFLEALNDTEAQRILVEWLQNIFPKKTITPPAAFHMTRHGLNPLTYMAFSTMRVGFTDEMFAQAFTPVPTPARCPKRTDRVFFSGEATCRAFNGYTHAALYSGDAAGQKVLNLLGHGDAHISRCEFFKDRASTFK